MDIILDLRANKAKLLTALMIVRDELDDHADAEGNGPGDYRPNWSMSLLQIVNDALKEK
jgi:hypothetical protein